VDEDGIRFAGALAAIRSHDSAFAQDIGLGQDYLRDWSGVVPRQAPLSTGSGNAWLTWQWQLHDYTRIAHAILESTQINFGTEDPRLNMPIRVWKQVLIEVPYADGSVWPLPSERYPALKLDGLPGGMFGYDYGRNPCGFAAIHFAGGWPARPTDLVTRVLAPAILGKRPFLADSMLPLGMDVDVHALAP
jgi:hypothetical protein